MVKNKRGRAATVVILLIIIVVAVAFAWRSYTKSRATEQAKSNPPNQRPPMMGRMPAGKMPEGRMMPGRPGMAMEKGKAPNAAMPAKKTSPVATKPAGK